MPNDMAKAAEEAAESIWANLMDRKGIKHELGACDPDIQEEIKGMMQQRILAAMQTVSGVG